MNIHGALCLETVPGAFRGTGDSRWGQRCASLAKVEASNPDKTTIHVIWDNAPYHKSEAVRNWLSRSECRINLIRLPAYCPHLNSIERLWALMHRYVTHNRFYPSQKTFANAILAFFRETIPKKWHDFRDQVTDNFRVISHENFRVLE